MPALALTLNGKTEYVDENDANRNDAMRRFWEAQQAGDNTANLTRVDAIPEPAANGAFDQDDDDDPSPAGPAAAGSVSELARDRIQLQETWLRKAGFAMDPPLYAPGTRVLPLGDHNFRLERQRVEALPSFGDAAGQIVSRIRAEGRRSVTSKLKNVALSERGSLLVDEQEYELELGAFYQLANLTGFGSGAKYLSELCESPLRAQNVNAQLAKRPERLVTLRLRRDDDAEREQVFATVTPKYTVVDTDEALALATDALSEARVEMLYDGTGVRATALWMPDAVVDLAAGDIFKTGVRITTDDTGRGRIRVSAVVWRNRCLNLLVIGEGTVDTVSAVHKGDRSRILDAVTEGIDEARAKVSDFLAAWGHARTVKVNTEELIARWVREKKVQVPGERDRDAVVESLLASWRQEPGDTLADAVNAVSRAAHEMPHWGFNVREELERQASRLVYVPR